MIETSGWLFELLQHPILNYQTLHTNLLKSFYEFPEEGFPTYHLPAPTEPKLNRNEHKNFKHFDASSSDVTHLKKVQKKIENKILHD
jgi:hypothetical protein